MFFIIFDYINYSAFCTNTYYLINWIKKINPKLEEMKGTENDDCDNSNLKSVALRVEFPIVQEKWDKDRPWKARK